MSARHKIKTWLKKMAPGPYASLAAARQSAALFGSIRGRRVDFDLLRDVIAKSGGTSAKSCPLCGHRGLFEAFGSPPRWNARCPSCGALERHRLFALCLRDVVVTGEVLHFAPEPTIGALLKRNNGVRYTSADLLRSDVDRNWNIEDIPSAADRYDVIVCSHVLEHVNDRKALAELYRILRPGGLLLAMVPITDGCSRTYEDDTVSDPAQREIHFGQNDHVRVYGADFASRLAEAGFDITVQTAFGREAIDHGLIMGEKLFLCRKPR